MKLISFIPIMNDARKAGRKTVTRRLMYPQPDAGVHEIILSNQFLCKVLNSKDTFAIFSHVAEVNGVKTYLDEQTIFCKYKPGETLYVKEPYFLYGNWQANGLTKKGNPKWKFVTFLVEGKNTLGVLYLDNPHPPYRISMDKKEPEKYQWYKRNSRFMPERYARDFITIKSIRAERLRDITKEEAIKEGVSQTQINGGPNIYYQDYINDLWMGFLNDPIASFNSLISLIHGPEILELNPWMWVIHFENEKD